MTYLKAVTYEKIPKNRLVVLTVQGKTEDDDRTRIRLAEKGEAPDFISTGSIEKGKEVTITITDKTNWEVETAEDVRSGVSVGTGAEGKLIEAVDGSVPQIGYTTKGASKGEVVSYVRNIKSGSSEKGEKGDPGPKGPKGDPGKDGFPTEEQWNDLVGRVEALEG